MKVRRCRKILALVASTLVSVSGLVIVMPEVALATDPTFTKWPSEHVPTATEVVDPFYARLYMLAASSSFSLPVGLTGIPVDGTMEFTGTDPIAGVERAIEVTTDAAPLCEPDSGNGYDTGPCPRLQLDVSGGDAAGGIRFSQDALTRIDDPGPPETDNRFWHTGGAVIDSITHADDPDQPQRVIYLNGSQDAINAALADLIYETGPDYKYNGNNGVTLTVLVASDDTATSADGKIEIRVLDVNQFPDISGPSDKGTLQPQTDFKMPPDPSDPPEFTASDVDNDEDVDNDAPDPPCPADDSGNNAPDGCDDPVDGPGSRMLLFGYMTCEKPILPDTGFHFASSTFEFDPPSLDDLFTDFLQGTPLGIPEVQAFFDAAKAFFDAIDPSLWTMPLASGSPVDFTTTFAGVTTMSEVQEALSQVTVRHDQPDDTCELYTVVSDLGNNGLPLHYFVTDPGNGDPLFGWELPFLGLDVQVTTFGTGPLDEIDVSWDSPTYYVMEGDPGDPVPDIAPGLTISPSDHPGVSFSWAAAPSGANPATPPPSSNDYQGSQSANLTIPAGTTTYAPDDTRVVNDDLDEGNETLTLTITPGTPPLGYTIVSDRPSVVVTIIDDDDAGATVNSFADASVTEGDTGTKDLTFTIGLDKPADGTESVDVTATAGTATNPADYGDPTPATVTFAPGATSATVTVPVVGDLLDEGDHSFTLDLSNPQGGLSITDGTAIGTIIDDDQTRTATVDDVSLLEGNSGGTSLMTFTVSLDLPAKGTEQLSVSTSDGTATDAGNDYEPVSNLLVPFALGDESKTVTVTINGDDAVEPDETFTVTLGSAQNVTIGDATGVGTITNDDGLPAASINDAQIVEGDAGTTSLNFTVSLSVPAIQASSVMVTSTDVSATAGSDFGAVSQLASFAPGEISKQVAVSITGDVTGEFDESFTLGLSVPSGVTIADGSGTGTITNDDLDVSFVPQGPVTEGAPASIVVGVFPPIHPEFSVGVAAVDGTAAALTDYTLVGTTVTIPANMPSGAGPATVFTTPDFDFEPDEQFTVVVTPSAPVPGFTVRWNGVPAAYTIVDDDPQSVVSIADAAVVEGGASSKTTLSLTNTTGRQCDVTIDATPGTATAADFGAVTPSLSLTSASTDLPLAIVDDSEEEAAEQFTVTIALDGLQPNCIIGDASATITIVDNDDPTPSLSIADASITEGTGAGTTTISFALTTSGLQPADCGFRAVVSHGTTTDADFVSPASFDQTAVFDTNDVVLTRTFDITRDVFDEPDETFTLTITGDGPTPCAIADGVATGTIIDDDAPLQPLSIADASVIEGTGVGTTQISLNVTAAGLQPADCGFRVAVTHVSTSNADFDTLDADLTAIFDTDDVTLPRTFDVVQDAIDETNETFTVTITGNGDNPCPIADGVATGTIVDDDGEPADATSPTVTIDQAAGQPDPTSASPILFTVVFSEPVTDFATGDVTLGGTAGATTATVSGSGTTYTVSVSGMTQSGTVTASVAGGVAHDAAANPNEASTSTDNSVQYDAPDTTDPTVTIDQAAGQLDPSSASPILFTVVFSEPVSDFATGDVTVSGTAGATLGTVTGSGTTYTVSVTDMTGSGTVIVSIAAGVAHDAADNPNEASTSTDNTVTFTVAPGPLTLNLPADITRNTDPGLATAVVTYTATASGGVPPVVVSCSPASGAAFPIGTTTVSCTAVDSDEAIASGSFTVTIVDAEPPVIADLADLTRTTTGTTPVTVTFVAPTASDNSGVAPTVACAPASGSAFPVGVTTVTCTATDGAGNSASSSFTVTVSSSGGLPPFDGGGEELPPTGASTPRTVTSAALLMAAGFALLGLRRRQSRSASA